MNVDKYTRTKYFKTNLLNGILEPDLLTNHFKDFEFSRQKKFYTITTDDIKRPELLSIKLYGKMNYWWIIMKVNNVEDIWNDLVVGDVISVPDVRDIEDFIASIK